MADYTKRTAEVIPVTADFTSVLGTIEHLETVLVQAFMYQADSIIQDYDLTDIDYVAIELSAGGITTFRRAFPVTETDSARLVLARGSVAADGIIDPATLDENYAIEVDEKQATVRIQAGSSGSTYRILFTAATSEGNVRQIEKTVDVTP